MLLKRAIKLSIKERTVQAKERIAKSFSMHKLRSLRRQHIFEATIFFEDRPDGSLRKVEVFGEFSNPPWQRLIPLAFNEYFRAFTCSIRIRRGNQFKFILNDHEYVTSKLYRLQYDGMGNSNNIYEPGALKPQKRLANNDLRQQFPNLPEFDENEDVPQHNRSNSQGIQYTNFDNIFDTLADDIPEPPPEQTYDESVFAAERASRVDEEHEKRVKEEL